jgi:hypothetical protein
MNDPGFLDLVNLAVVPDHRLDEVLVRVAQAMLLGRRNPNEEVYVVLERDYLEVADMLRVVDLMGDEGPLFGPGMELGAPISDNNIQDIATTFLRYLVGDANMEQGLLGGKGVLEEGVQGPSAWCYWAREPYTVTTKLRETNWFEKSKAWPNKWFRKVYR